MKLSDHQRQITAALNSLMSDRTIPLVDARDAFEEVKEEVSGIIDALNEDIDKTGGIS